MLTLTVQPQVTVERLLYELHLSVVSSSGEMSDDRCCRPPCALVAWPSTVVQNAKPKLLGSSRSSSEAMPSEIPTTLSSPSNPLACLLFAARTSCAALLLQQSHAGSSQTREFYWQKKLLLLLLTWGPSNHQNVPLEDSEAGEL